MRDVQGPHSCRDAERAQPTPGRRVGYDRRKARRSALMVSASVRVEAQDYEGFSLRLYDPDRAQSLADSGRYFGRAY
jgi:hypothetical protein